MLRWCIWLDLQEHPFLSVDQPAFTVELPLVSGVIRLLLPHQTILTRLPKGMNGVPPLLRRLQLVLFPNATYPVADCQPNGTTKSASTKRIDIFIIQ